VPVETKYFYFNGVKIDNAELVVTWNATAWDWICPLDIAISGGVITKATLKGWTRPDGPFSSYGETWIHFNDKLFGYFRPRVGTRVDFEYDVTDFIRPPAGQEGSGRNELKIGHSNPNFPVYGFWYHDTAYLVIEYTAGTLTTTPLTGAEGPAKTEPTPDLEAMFGQMFQFMMYFMMISMIMGIMTAMMERV